MRSTAPLLAEMMSRLFSLPSPTTQNKTRAHLGTCQTFTLLEDMKQIVTRCQDNNSPCEGFFPTEILSSLPLPGLFQNTA